MYIILNLDDFRNIEIVTDSNCNDETMLFSDYKEAEKHAEENYAIYQIVELEEN